MVIKYQNSVENEVQGERKNKAKIALKWGILLN